MEVTVFHFTYRDFLRPDRRNEPYFFTLVVSGSRSWRSVHGGVCQAHANSSAHAFTCQHGKTPDFLARQSRRRFQTLLSGLCSWLVGSSMITATCLGIFLCFFPPTRLISGRLFAALIRGPILSAEIDRVHPGCISGLFHPAGCPKGFFADPGRQRQFARLDCTRVLGVGCDIVWIWHLEKLLLPRPLH